MLPCSCGVRAVFSVVIAAAVVEGKTVVHFEQLRGFAPVRALDDPGEERRGAGGAKLLELPPAEAIGEHDDDLTRAVEEVRIELAERRRIVIEPLAEGRQHSRRDVEESLPGVVRQHRAARA